MEAIHVYRNINSADKFMGLELADGGILLLTFFFAFMLNKNGLFTNLALLILVYIGLRALKRGKPDGYLLVLGRYVLMTRFKRPAGYEEAECPR